MPDKLQVIAMRSNPNTRDARMDRIVDLWDKWTTWSVTLVTGIAIGALITMKIMGG